MEMIAVSYLFFRIGFANPIFGVGGIARVLFSFLLMSSIKVVTHNLIFFDTLPPLLLFLELIFMDYHSKKVDLKGVMSCMDGPKV